LDPDVEFTTRGTKSIISGNDRIFEKDPVLFWRPSKLREFRGREHKILKDEDCIRIVCLGDSTTEGYRLKLAETYPYILETLLNKGRNSNKFEVINAGVAGYSSLQSLRYFKKRIMQYDPDIITLQLGLNDMRPAVVCADKDKGEFINVADKLNTDLFNVLNKSALFRFLVYLNGRVLHRIGKIKDNNGRPIRRVEPDDFYNNYVELIKIANQNKIAVVLLTLQNKHHNDNEYNSIVWAIAQAYNIPIADICSIFWNSREKDLFIDDIHPTALGNQIIASEIYEIINLNSYKERQI